MALLYCFTAMTVNDFEDLYVLSSSLVNLSKLFWFTESFISFDRSIEETDLLDKINFDNSVFVFMVVCFLLFIIKIQ